jgi:hypothetical protein
MESWTYDSITATAEAQIKRLMECKETMPAATVRFRRDWAYGVYILWYELTCGWQADGDDRRLRELTALEKEVQP